MACLGTWLGRHVESMDPGRSGNGDVEARELNKVGGGLNGSLTVLRECLEAGCVEEAGAEGDGEVSFKRKLLESVIRQLLPQPNFPTLLCEAVRQIRGLSDQFLRDLCQALELGLPERLLLGLALGCAEDKSRRRESQRFCAQVLADLLHASGAELSEELLHQLSCHLHRIGRAGRVSLASLGSVPEVQRKAEQSLLLAPLGVGEGSEVNCLRTFEQVAGDSYFGRNDLMEELAGASDVAHVAEELGYECASDRQRCTELFSLFPAITEAEAAKVVGMVARTHAGLDPAAGTYGPFAQAFCSTSALPAAESHSLTAWDVDVLRDTLQGCHLNLDWVAVMEQLDHEGFVVPDQKAFDALLSFFKEVSQDNFPIHRVVGRVWKNHDAQLSFLKYALAGSSDGIPYPLTPDKQSDEKGWRDCKSPYDAQQWNSLDMSAVLCQLAEMGHAGSLRPVLKNLVNWNPGLLMMKVAAIKTEWNVVRTDLSTMLVPQLILGENVDSNRSNVRQLWRANSDIVTRTLISVHARDPNTALKSVEQCLKLEELQHVLDAAPFSFSIDVAVMHWKESLADLERWLEKHLGFQKDVMLRACVMFLQSKAAESEPGRSSPVSGPLPLPVQAVFFKVVLEGSGTEAFKGALRSLNEQPDVMLRTLCNQFMRFPELQEKERHAIARAFGSLIQVSPKATELGVRYIQAALGNPMHSKLFSFGLVALEQCKERLMSFPGFCKAILQLGYPREAYGELAPLLEEGASIAGITVPPLNPNMTSLPGLELVKNVPSATLASDTLVVPKQVKQISLSQQQLPPLSQSGGQLPSERLDDISQQDTRGSPQGRQLGWGMASNGASAQSVVEADQTSDSMGHALPINTLLAARSKSSIPTPDSEVRSKLTFIVNNISTGNLELKAKEIKAVLQDQYLVWFAQYLVVERASIEPNFHDLYLKFLDAISTKSLLNEVIQATYENCKVLLNSPLLRSSAGERSLLKHLGAWLGKLTIGRNQVLRARDLDPKGLLIEAYEKGLMFAVLPFTCKILEACQNSHVYRPPNPWTTAILGLLAEIYVQENLQKNLQFEIEILFKNINVELQTVRPSELLVGRTHLVEGNVDFRWRSTVVSQQVVVKEEKSASVQVEPPPDVSSSGVTIGKSWISVPHVTPVAPSYEDSGSAHGMRRSGQLGVDLGVSYQPPSSIVPSTMSVPPSVIMNQRLLSCGEKFRVLVQKGMEKAIQETLQYILEHYLVLACKTTTVLVAKDYAGEDPSSAQEAAYIMVAGLSSRLAGLCKDLFRNAMYNNIALMLSKGLNIQGEILGQAVELVTTDNLSLGFGAVEDATIRFALARMKKLAETEAARRQAGSPFEGSGFEGSRFSRQSHDVQQPTTVRSSNSWQQAYEGYALLLPQKNVMAAKVATAPGPFPEPGGYSFPAEPISGVHLPEMPDEELDPSARLPMGFVSNALFDEAIQLQDKKPSHNEDGATLLDLTSESNGNPVSPVTSLPSSGLDDSLAMNVSNFSTAEALEQCEAHLRDLETAVPKANAFGVLTFPPDHDVWMFPARIAEVVSRCVRRDEAAIAVLKEVLRRIFEEPSSHLHYSVYVSVLESLRDVSSGLVKEITKWMIYPSDQDKKLNSKIVADLIRAKLMYVPAYDQYLAKLIESGRNTAFVKFAVLMFRHLDTEKGGVNSTDFMHVNDALQRYAQRPGSPKVLRDILKEGKNVPSGAVVGGVAGREGNLAQKLMLYPGTEQQKEGGALLASGDNVVLDGASLREQASLRDQAARFFQKWMVICETAAVPSDKICMEYMSQLQRSGFLDIDDTFDLFFQNLLELAVTHSLNSDAPPVSLFQTEEGLSFAAIDTFAKLVVLLVKRDAGEPKMAGVNLVKKILRVTVHVIQKNADEKTHNFHPRLYFRLFVTWLIDFSGTEWDTAKGLILSTFANAFLALQPSRLPSWTFAWWELVSHRKFMPRLLLSSAESGWALFHRLLVVHLRFMEPSLRVAVLPESMRALYKGTLRVLLVLVHDFPEFLCAYYFSLCGEIPPTCIQMRNLILSAFPRSITLPDPLSANLKVDMLPDMKVAPRILSDVGLGDDDLKSEVDQYLRTWHPESVSSTLNLKQRLMLSEDEVRKAGTQYNVPLLRALVLHVGIEAIKILQSPTQDSQAKQIGRNAPMAIFHSLMVELDREGRHLFCSALADQLRYPNSHTHYFSCVLLYLFAKFKDETWREQIARVLIERYVARRPHPWGLQVTVIELARNSGLGLWETSFMADPHIRGLFASFLPVSGK